MTHKKKAPADAPSTLKDPDYVKRQRAKAKAEKERYDQLCGPVTVITDAKLMYVSIDPEPNAYGYALEEVKSHVEQRDGDDPRGSAGEGAGD